MKLFNMYRKKQPKSSRSVTSHSTYDIASVNSLRSFEDTLQASTPKNSPTPSQGSPTPSKSSPKAFKNTPTTAKSVSTTSKGAAGAKTVTTAPGSKTVTTAAGAKTVSTVAGAKTVSTTSKHPTTTKKGRGKKGDSEVPMTVDEEERSGGDAQTTASTYTPTTTTSSRTMDASSSTKRPKEKREDTYEERERKQKNEAMANMWRKSALPKKLPIPTRYPSYLKEPPELSYEETTSSIRRKQYNDSKIKMSQGLPPKKGPVKTKQVEAKSNKAAQLRNTYIRKDPIVSQYFSDHYNTYKKPPFQLHNIRICK